MKQKTPGRVDARHRGEIEAGEHNLVPPSQYFNRKTGPRLLRDVMTRAVAFGPRRRPGRRMSGPRLSIIQGRCGDQM